MGDEVQDLSYRNGTVKELSFPKSTLENRVIQLAENPQLLAALDCG
jgi:hypothetical protein